ncbi:MAG: hypothetical protein IJA12_02185 [Oscillospiraceae bacterium]|nr:hypothetical protein [Oscillospiraceae bacterium]
MTRKKIFSVLLSAILVLMCVPFGASAVIKGDANGDGMLTIRDAAYIAGSLSRRKAIDDAGDYNGDGKVDIRDASAIAAKLVTPYADYAIEVLELVNQERASLGLSPLVLDVDLNKAANVRAEEASEVFSHTRPDGTSFATVLKDFSISYYCCGENIAAGCPTAEVVVAQWINSPAHYENIIDPNYTKLGVGFYYDANSPYGYYWSQIFKCD